MKCINLFSISFKNTIYKVHVFEKTRTLYVLKCMLCELLQNCFIKIPELLFYS